MILSHIQLVMTCWECEWSRINELQKRADRIIPNNKYNARVETLSKDMHLLKTTDVFDVQCMNFWYKFSNDTIPNEMMSTLRMLRYLCCLARVASA